MKERRVVPSVPPWFVRLARTRARGRLWGLGALLTLAALLFYRFGKPLWKPMAERVNASRTVATVLRDLGPAAEGRLAPLFAKAGAPFPPSRLALLGFKAEKRLEVWAGVADGPWRHIRDYPLLAASGGPGPKLREGDGQVPEGLYRVELLNPRSRYHLSLRLDYPNAFDREMARRDGRTDPGGDIYIHGRSVSIGCLAVGDEAVEELFVLAARTGLPNVRVILAPADFRADPAAAGRLREPAWVDALYAAIHAELGVFRPQPGPPGK